MFSSNQEDKMPDNDAVQLGIPQGMTAELAIGFDVPRQWANGVQVTVSGDTVFLVFREQVNFEGKDDEPSRVSIKNVGSFVVPLVTALQLREVLNAVIAPPEEAEQTA
jgi:hypothetical protein